MAKSKIEWTQTTWNPTTGCNKISPGCKHCYAEIMTKRLQGIKQQTKYQNGFNFTMHPTTINDPLSWREPRLIFVNSMSDLFHKDVTDVFLKQVFATMNQTPQHTYQVLTKRGDILLAKNPILTWSGNIWQGVSVENDKYIHRIDELRKTDAHVKWLSLEPLLGPLQNLDLTGIDWVVVGGESGKKARHMDPDWVRDILAQCQKAKVPFFFKQWGGANKKKTGRVLDGRTWDEYPKGFQPPQPKAKTKRRAKKQTNNKKKRG